MTNRRLIVNIQRRGGEDRDAIVEAHVRRIVGEIMSVRLANTIRITIKMRAGFTRALGQCEFRSNATATARSKHYTVTVRRDLPTDRLLCTLTHELAHVEQMATDRLKFRLRGGKGAKVAGYLFRSKDERRAQFWPLKTLPQWGARPWEFEAMVTEARFHGPEHGPKFAPMQSPRAA